ncbi:hypothetical protein H0A71_16620 [Alcaligenaceae bacterium]|nr:hypothetical protein [Alcaligenaceae bacterium]
MAQNGSRCAPLAVSVEDIPMLRTAGREFRTIPRCAPLAVRVEVSSRQAPMAVSVEDIPALHTACCERRTHLHATYPLAVSIEDVLRASSVVVRRPGLKLSSPSLQPV